MTEHILERDFAVPVPARLELSNLRGRVDIRSGGTDAIHITACKHAGSENADATRIELSQAADGTVKAVTQHARRGWNPFHATQPCPVDYTIIVPQSCSLKIHLISSEASIENIHGDCEVSSISGDLSLQSIEGNLRLETKNGNISGRRLIGSLFLYTVSGEVCLDDSSLTSIMAETVSARMDFQTSLGAGPYYFGSVSGAVRLRLPAEAACTIDMHSGRGMLTSKIPITRHARLQNDTLTDIRGGGITLRMNSISGCMFLETI